MESALHIKTKVLPGKKIEIAAPDLIEGEAVEVFVVMPKRRGRRRRTVLDMIEDKEFPKARRTAEEIDRYIQEERDSWDR